LTHDLWALRNRWVRRPVCSQNRALSTVLGS